MVSRGVWAAGLLLQIAAEAEAEPLNRQTRVGLLAALAGLLILSFALLVLTWLGARIARRYGDRGSDRLRRRPSIPDEDDWARKPLNPPLRPGEPSEDP